MTCKYYFGVNQVVIGRLEELKQVFKKPMSKIVTQMFENLKEVDNKYFYGYKRSGANEEIEDVDDLVYPHAILIMEGDKEVRLPFTDEFKEFYKKRSPYLRKQSLYLWLDESVMENIRTMRKYMQGNLGETLEEIVNMYYYDIILKPKLEAERQRKEAEELQAELSDPSYWKAPKKK